MSTLSRQKLSASTSGAPIQITTNASPGTTLHTCPGGLTQWDMIYLWVVNTSSAAIQVTVGFGGVTQSNLFPQGFSIPANSQQVPLLSGLMLQNGLSVTCWASSINVANVGGYVNRLEGV